MKRKTTKAAMSDLVSKKKKKCRQEKDEVSL